jgi:hypothetical protein
MSGKLSLAFLPVVFVLLPNGSSDLSQYPAEKIQLFQDLL